MENQIKWADVAHYYQFADIEIQIGIGQRKFKGVSQHDSVRGGAKRALFADSGGIFVRSTQYEISEYKPILRHRDDMTEAEARECFKIYDGTEDATLSDVTDVLYFDANQMASTLEVWLGDPRVWHYLLQKGFDLFGLIESGQAIRK